MPCKRLVIDVIQADLDASDDGFVYYTFVDCGGDDVEVGYNTARLNFDTGYCMDVDRDYTAHILIGGIPTPPPNFSTATEGDTCTGSDPVEIPPAVVPPAYGKKYTLQAIGKSGLTFTAEIWEKGYTGGTVYPIGASVNPFVLDCLASGDDPFQPVLPTTFTIRADFTEFTGPWPDFLSTDDRKYHVRFYAQGTAYFIWQGFILMDNITLPFTTGRTIVDILCVDAIALLKSVNYLPGVPLLTSTESIVKTINNCLTYLLYPGGYKVNFAVNYYTSQLTEANNALRQMYVTQCNWQSGVSSYLNCYEILEIICTAFGAQIFQSGGEWWITSVNERASDTIRVFQTNQDTDPDTTFNKSINYTIQPYINDSVTPFYFVQNSQVKILTKGFPQVEVTGELSYCFNKLINGDFSKLTPYGMPAITGIPDNWTYTLESAIGKIERQTYRNITGLQLTGNVVSPGTDPTQITSTGVLIDQSDKVILSFDFAALTGGGSPGWMNLQIYIDVGSGNTWRYTKKIGEDAKWLYNPSNNDSPYRLEGTLTTDPQAISIESVPAPADGTLYIRFNGGGNVTGAFTEVFVANCIMTLQSLYSSRTIKNVINSNPYKKQIDVKLGNNYQDGFIGASRTQSQSLLTSGNVALVNFYRYGTPATTYNTLANLLLSQAYNIVSKPQVNIQFSQYGLFNQSDNYVIGLVNNFAVSDPSGKISISGARFVLGACTIDYVNNTINGIGLQIANAVLTFSISETYTRNDKR
jgi:hypothetical protein